MLTDENGNPIGSDEKPKNGQNHGRETVDIRTLPTPVLLYNFVKFVNREDGLEGIIMQFEAAKAQQKMVTDPPELQALYAEREAGEGAIYKSSSELSLRFKDFDAAFAVCMCGGVGGVTVAALVAAFVVKAWRRMRGR
jgi:hypothetical protein